MATTFAVPDGRVAMAATLYTGNGSTNTISNAINAVGMQPDLLWTKARSTTAYHYIQNSVVGVNKALYSNTTDSEYTLTTTTTALNTNGFSFNGPESGLNASAATYIGWQWKAGGTAVSNTAGTITSSVSANTTAGFSVVTYTGNGSASATVGHGLGVIPGMVIEKRRNAVSNWFVYFPQIGSGGTYFEGLNTTSAGNTSSTSQISFSSTLGTINNATDHGANGINYVWYCWAPVAGYSAFGSYTGNGSADGPFVYTGFRPRFILVKSSSNAATAWQIFDTSINPYNAAVNNIAPHSAVAEPYDTASPIDFLSNGFKLRGGASSWNNYNTGTWIYAAFAENPLKYSNAR